MGQSLRAYRRAGDKAFNTKDFGVAFRHYGDLLKRKPGDSELQWKYAECSRLLYSCKEAENTYKQMLEADSGIYKKFPLIYFRLAEVQKMQGNYASAASDFDLFLKTAPVGTDTLFLEKAVAEADLCRDIRVLDSRRLPAEVKHPGKEINSPWYDFAPAISGDTLYYSSARFDRKTKVSRKKTVKVSRTMISVSSGRSREPGRGFPVTDTAHVAHTAFTPDKRYVFFTICKDINASEKRCELWVTALDRRSKWLTPKKLPANINMPGYTTTHPNVGYDTGRQSLTLWFASDRPGGKGKLDIWSVPLDTNYFCPCNIPIPGKQLSSLPSFSQPVNVYGINTPGDDITPFYDTNTGRLYFSSDSWPGHGGQDIFYAEKEQAPVNAGSEINSSYNDLYLSLSERGDAGYFSSNRPGSFYLDEKNKTCCNDLFSFKLKRDTTLSIPVIPVPEAVQQQTDTIPPQIVPDQERLDDFGGLPLYFDNDQPDSRTRNPATRKSYSETVVRYLARRDEYRVRHTAGLKGSSAEEAASASDSFFDEEVRTGAERLNQLCELLLERLEAGEIWEIQLRGFTSPRAESDYNLYLAKRRIKSVMNELETWQEGSLKKYIDSAQLKINELSLGETTSKTGISDKITDEKNSIYHPDAARERRVEIVRIIDLKF
ncbi:MAG: hypothetical protein ACK5Q2_17570 [Bacteroidota bacterium]